MLTWKTIRAWSSNVARLTRSTIGTRRPCWTHAVIVHNHQLDLLVLLKQMHIDLLLERFSMFFELFDNPFLARWWFCTVPVFPAPLKFKNDCLNLNKLRLEICEYSGNFYIAVTVFTCFSIDAWQTRNTR